MEEKWRKFLTPFFFPLPSYLFFLLPPRSPPPPPPLPFFCHREQQRDDNRWINCSCLLLLSIFLYASGAQRDSLPLPPFPAPFETIIQLHYDCTPPSLSLHSAAKTLQMILPFLPPSFPLFPTISIEIARLAFPPAPQPQPPLRTG